MYLRPNRKFSQVCDPSAVAALPSKYFDMERLDDTSVNVHYLPGIKYRVSRLTLAANRAVLATPGEYAKIRAQEGTIQHQNVQREVQAMRSSIAETTDRQMSPEQKQRLESMRALERAEERRVQVAEEAQRRAIDDHKAAELAMDRDKLEQQLEAMTAADLEQRISSLRESTAQLAGRYGEKAKTELLRLAEDEEKDLRARWEAIQTRRALTRQADARHGSGSPAESAGAGDLRGPADSGALLRCLDRRRQPAIPPIGRRRRSPTGSCSRARAT